VPSLNGFVPQEHRGPFTAIIDARIGGAYVRRGVSTETGIAFLSDPQVCPLEELDGWLQPTTHLVTPNSLSLKPKLEKHFPHCEWQWEERFPSISSLAQSIRTSFAQGKGTRAGELSLLYLRKTEAERISMTIMDENGQ
jgi:tRNA threonylcarbamoyladenosine biosynthesis protein TsaB